MNILILNFYYEPTTDAHAYRWAQIARYYSKIGHNVEVITGKVSGSPYEEVLFGVRVKRVGMIKKKTVDGLNVRATNGINKLQLSFVNSLRPLYRALYWPDASWHWAPAVFKEVYLRRKNHYDIVVSYYPCFAAHLAASFLKRVSKFPNFKWVLDYGDPFSVSETWQPNNYRIYDRINRSIERRYAKSGTMVLTNEQTRKAYLSNIGEDLSIKVLPHLVDLNKFYNDICDSKVREDCVVNWLYIGSFHPGIREPHRLLALARALNKRGYIKVKLNMYGPANGFDLNPNDCPEIRHWGYLDRDLAVEKLKNADFIVNVDNENCVMTPSKIVECIATGRPIINIANANTPYEPMQAYEELGYVFTQYEKDIDELVLQRAELFIKRHLSTCSMPKKDLFKLLSGHLMEHVAESYLKL